MPQAHLGAPGDNCGYFAPMCKAQECCGRALYAPAFFSAAVSDFQSSRILSLSAIHRSACSWGGIDSQRLSRFASVGLEMAWAWRNCCSWLVTGTVLGTAAARVARTIEVRIMAAVEWRELPFEGPGNANGWW